MAQVCNEKGAHTVLVLKLFSFFELFIQLFNVHKWRNILSNVLLILNTPVSCEFPEKFIHFKVVDYVIIAGNCKG